MAVSFADGDEPWYRVDAVPTETAYTWCIWAYYNSLADSDLIAMHDNAWDVYDIWGYASGSGDFRNQTHAATVEFTNFTPSAGQWYFFAGTRNGNTVTFYWAAVSDASISSQALTNNYSSTNTRTDWGGGSSTGGWQHDGNLIAAKIWDRVLSANEIAQERWTITPKIHQSLLDVIPMLAQESTPWNFFGGHAWSANGTLATAPDNPPISWGYQNGLYVPLSVQLEQEGYRWRNDDNDEINATWRQDQDTVDTVAVENNIRLRTLINATGDPDAKQFRLEYRRSAGSTSWVPLGTV
jgi:hypothetical protein